jgi:hypothetical protein
MNNKKIILIFLVILALGAFLRFYKLGQQPFVTDEFLDINATYGYFKTGQWLAWDFNLNQVSENLYAQRDERSWLYRIQVAQIFHFFALTEAAARSVSALWGVISIAVLYFTATYFTKNKTVGLIAAFLFAVSAAGITFDRMLRMYAMFFPVFLLFSWFLFRFFEEEYQGKIKFIKIFWKKAGINLVWFLPVTLLGLLSFHIHPLALNIGPVLVAYFITQGIIFFYQKKQLLNKYFITFTFFLVSLVGAYLFGSNIFSFYSKTDLISFDNMRLRYILAAVSDYSITILTYSLIFFGAYVSIRKLKRIKETVWLASCFFVILIAAIFFWNENFGLRFIFFAMSFGIILLSSGLYFLAERVGKYFPNQRRKVFLGVLLALLIILPNYGYFFSKESPYRINGARANYRAAFGYFMENKNEKDVLITRNFRSFYYKNTGVKVVNKEWSKKISVADLEKIMTENPNGWIVSGDPKGDLEKEAIKYMEENSMDKKEVSGVQIYHWQK